MSLDDRVTPKAAPPPPPHPAGSRRPKRLVPQQAPDPLRAPLATATVQPGQTLVLATPDASITPEDLEAIRDRLPGVEVVVLSGVAQMAVFDAGAGQIT